ncbi:MAG: nuclear transport factor 2 family protein [Polyangiaceae bacterium]
MSKNHKQTLKEANAAIVAGDFEGFLERCTEDTEWIFIGDETLSGKTAVREWMRKAYKSLPRFNVTQLIAEGNIVVAIGQITVRDEDGNDTDSAYCDVWEFRDDKMARLRAYVVAKRA